MQTTSVSSQDDSDDDLETQKQHNRDLADVEHEILSTWKYYEIFK